MNARLEISFLPPVRALVPKMALPTLCFACLAYSGSVWSQSPRVPDTQSNWIIEVLHFGAIGVAAIGMCFGFYLLNNGKRATSYLIMSSVFFLAALGVETAKYFWPNLVMISVTPGDYPTTMPPPSLMDNEVAMALVRGKGHLTCEPSHTIYFDVQNLVDRLREAERNLGQAAVANNVGHVNSDFGPDTGAGN
jgi:hypothetical protein